PGAATIATGLALHLSARLGGGVQRLLAATSHLRQAGPGSPPPCKTNYRRTLGAEGLHGLSDERTLHREGSARWLQRQETAADRRGTAMDFWRAVAMLSRRRYLIMHSVVVTTAL